jgi:two-component system, OmpR family, sensor kinase
MISTSPKGEHGSPAQVTSLVNHELSSPLATALLYIGIAEGHCAAGPAVQARSALSVARAEIQRLKQLVDRVTELEQLGRAVLRPAQVDLGAVVADTVERAMLPDIAGESPVTIESPRGLVGWWDDIAVGQIVINLLSNALKFGHGGPVRVVVRASGDHAWISVQDSGVGVRPADRERIFERHACVPPDQGGGLGLGLWLVRELAIAHGGRAVVHSRPGHGATFVVHLRSQPPAAAVTPLAIGRTAGRSRPTGSRRSDANRLQVVAR